MATQISEYDIDITNSAVIRGGQVISYQGDYSPTTSYQIGDSVLLNGILYLSIYGACGDPNLGNDPETTTGFWLRYDSGSNYISAGTPSTQTILVNPNSTTINGFTATEAAVWTTDGTNFTNPISGTYSVNYAITGNISAIANVASFMSLNGTSIPGSAISLTDTQIGGFELSNSFIVAYTAGDNLTLSIGASLASGVLAVSGIDVGVPNNSATLTIVKI